LGQLGHASRFVACFHGDVSIRALRVFSSYRLIEVEVFAAEEKIGKWSAAFLVNGFADRRGAELEVRNRARLSGL
jgi:hypothetical protein